eukprot:1158064-Pelagomonas_calceolata.AAC.2
MAVPKLASRTAVCKGCRAHRQSTAQKENRLLLGNRESQAEELVWDGNARLKASQRYCMACSWDPFGPARHLRSAGADPFGPARHLRGTGADCPGHTIRKAYFLTWCLTAPAPLFFLAGWLTVCVQAFHAGLSRIWQLRIEHFAAAEAASWVSSAPCLPGNQAVELLAIPIVTLPHLRSLVLLRLLSMSKEVPVSVTEPFSLSLSLECSSCAWGQCVRKPRSLQ